MASYYPQLFASVRAAITAFWPECAGPGKTIYHEVELAQVPFERIAEGGFLPVATMGFRLAPSTEFGLTNFAEDGPVRLHYLARQDYDTDALVERLEAAREWLIGHPLTPAVGEVDLQAPGPQRFDNPAVNFDMDVPANSFFTGTQRPFKAGMVTFRVVVAVQRGAP